MYDTGNKQVLLKESLKTLKKNKLRYNEYYNMQPILDNLYKQSKEGSKFKHLFNLIIEDENILLAYRTIKRNKGSNTAGTNKHTIKYWENKPINEFLSYIKTRLWNYKPQKIRRKEILKSNGKVRPLGIPCIEDRIIQQCIKQILEPICEAKFHHHSYGFRPNRSTENAIAYLYKKINLDKCYYMVDVDIKGFFDHVNHNKLLKQIWTMGIQDKKVISIISDMLKAEIKGIGIPTEGVPQGGILSPLLSNIVLNELDWWISNQWETYESHYEYKENYLKYKHFRRNCNLKEMYIVRYADDFKILCKNHEEAQRIYRAVEKWLKDRLNLEISPEKSGITDVRTNYTDFLGIKTKARKKGCKYVVTSKVTNKAKKAIQEAIKEQIKYVQNRPNGYTVYILNRIIAGVQNYYKIATEVNRDFSEIEYKLSQCLKQRLRSIRTKAGTKSEEYYSRYKNYKGKEINILKVTLYPIRCISTKPPKLCNHLTTDYTCEGRELLHKSLGYIYSEVFKWITDNPIRSRSVEYNDNRLSLYAAQKGKCAITKIPLDYNMEMHHIIPIEQGGNDRYNNLILISNESHKLIHALDKETIKRYLKGLNINKAMLNKLNKFRNIIENELIIID